MLESNLLALLLTYEFLHKTGQWRKKVPRIHVNSFKTIPSYASQSWFMNIQYEQIWNLDKAEAQTGYKRDLFPTFWSLHNFHTSICVIS